MKTELEIEDEWLPFEIHPDTPQAGVLWKDYFPGMDPDAFFRQLDGRGREMGVRFGRQPLMSNSREALEGGEFAKDHGRYDVYHEAVFKAFFTDGLDIGDRNVLLNAARTAGLDPRALDAALQARRYNPRLQETTRKAKSLSITSAPTFLIGGNGRITGAQPIDAFRRALREVESRTTI